MTKIKNKLIGKRVVLKRLKPSIKLAAIMFKVIDKNRQHLRPWLSWEKSTLRIEDSLKYLFEMDKKAKKGEEFGYGIYIDNEYAGNIGIFDIDEKNKSAEIGYWLSAEFFRKGYMTEAVSIIEREVFLNTDLNRIRIKCDERNIASAGVIKKCGYIFEGKFRKDTYSEYFKDFRNTLVFSKLKSEFKKKGK